MADALGEVRTYEGRRWVCWHVATDGRAFAKTLASPVRYLEFTALQWRGLPLALAEVALA